MTQHHVWTIVLAGGAGKRLAAVTDGVPKQYWRQGRPDAQCLLQQTLARFETAAALDRTITLVAAEHRGYVARLRPYSALGRVMYQPADRGTATGVLLPLTAVIADDADAIVVITPSDHAVEDSHPFRNGITRAVRRIDDGSAEIVLFGVHASTPSTDFGWIVPGSSGTNELDRFRRVTGFFEKPPARIAGHLFGSGAVWNTMVVVARASSLLRLFCRYLPFHSDVLVSAARCRQSDRHAFLEDWYEDLGSADFCRDVLTPAAQDLWVYTWPAEMGWSDLGSPERLEPWLARQRQPGTRTSNAA